MTSLTLISEARCFGGRQITYSHPSQETGTTMRFAVFLPPKAEHEVVPTLWWLSGLTCTEDNFSQKAGAQRVAAELGLMMVMPDTSPRGDDVPDDPNKAFDFGLGAGFYLDATEAPWSANYRMYTYITRELAALIASNLPADMSRQSIFGHSMGGHGALTIALKHPGRFRSVSAFAPIAAPMQGAWGRKAFSRYLGPDESSWRAYDATALVQDGARVPRILIDQGMSDPWLEKELSIDTFEAACNQFRQPVTLRRQIGYDHGFYFISTFMEEHIRWHATSLCEWPGLKEQAGQSLPSAALR